MTRKKIFVFIIIFVFILIFALLYFKQDKVESLDMLNNSHVFKTSDTLTESEMKGVGQELTKLESREELNLLDLERSFKDSEILSETELKEFGLKIKKEENMIEDVGYIFFVDG